MNVPVEIQDFGAFHSAEIQYIFQTAVPFFNRPAKFIPEQKRLSKRMQQAWFNFARDGIPSVAREEAWASGQFERNADGKL